MSLEPIPISIKFNYLPREEYLSQEDIKIIDDRIDKIVDSLFTSKEEKAVFIHELADYIKEYQS